MATIKQYIDKDAIMAEIKRKLQDLIVCKRDTSFIEHKVVLSAKIDMCKEILSILDNLEVKEVDIEKEIKEQINKYYDDCEQKLKEMDDNDNDFSFMTLDNFAKHFYELGLKAQKG